MNIGLCQVVLTNNNNSLHLQYIVLFSALESLYIVGGISSTTTNVQHPPG